MRPEKTYLVRETASHLAKSDYVFLADFQRITVSETAALRQLLAAEKAEFHVVKNSLFRVAAEAAQLPTLDSCLKGHTAIIVGGRNPAGVARILAKFTKDKQKGDVKGGALGKTALSAADVDALSKLPELPVMRAQFLGLLNAPASQLVRVINGVPQAMVNVLQAKVRQEQGEAA